MHLRAQGWEGSRAASITGREQPLPSTSRGCRGRGLAEVCATSLVRQSTSCEQLCALGQVCSGHRSPGEGAGPALLHLIHAALGALLEMPSQPPVMQDLAELVFLGGQGSHRSKAHRGLAAHSPCPSKGHCQGTTRGSYSRTRCSVCGEHFKVS